MGGKGISLLEKDGLNQLYQVKLENAIRNLPNVSFFLIREAERARKKGDSERSVELAAYSVKISPDMPKLDSRWPRPTASESLPDRKGAL